MRAKQPDQTGHVSRDGVRIYYEVYGAGPQTMLFVPPWSIVHSRVYKAQLPYFSERFRCVTDAAACRRCDTAKSGEAAANDTADRRGQQPHRQYRCNTPGHQAMQDAVETHLDAGKPSCDKAADADGQATGEDPPDTGTNSKRAGHWRAARIGVDGVEADTRTEQAE